MPLRKISLLGEQKMKSAIKTVISISLVFLFFDAGYCDSLWTTQEGTAPDALVMDHRAGKVGDVITVLIVESSTVSQKATSSRDRQSAINLEVKNWSQPVFHHGIGTKIDRTTNMPIYEVAGTGSYSGGGAYTGAYNIRAQVTTKIIEVLPNKNLVVEGSSEVLVNSERNTVAVSGIIRPQDIGPNNTVLSTQLADAKVRLIGKGPISDKTRRGIFETILDWIWPF
jgi:flagellar L-ring protein FlgH